jgi:hypothetical protein
MAVMARAIGNDSDAVAWEARRELAKTAFREKLFNDTAGIYRDGVGTNHSSVHANFFPLAFGLVPSDKISGVVAWLSERDMKCSVYAAQYLMDGLFANGADKRAIDLIVADNDRSWKHMLNSGATITWEAWDMKYKPNQDWNHAWGAAPANLFPRHILGVQVAEAGWSRALIKPCVGELKFARGKVPTSRGPIHVEWTNENAFQMSLRLPAELSATISVPAGDAQSKVFVNGKQSDATREGDRWVLNEPVSGEAKIEVK